MRSLSVAWLICAFLVSPLPLCAQDTKLSIRMSVETAESGSLLIKGKLSDHVPMPDINDFRLERIGEDEVAQFVPLLFGNERSMSWPKAARFDQLEFHLEPIRTRNRLQQVQSEAEKSKVRLYGDALLHPGFKYQLTWKCRQGDAVSPATIQFRYQPADPRPPGVDPRPAELPADLPERFYLCEILFRDQHALFLGQRILPRLNPQDFSMAAVSFSADGESLYPPDPGHQRIKMLTDVLVSIDPSYPVPKPPLANRTSHYGANASSRWDIRVSDMGTVAELPTKPGQAVFEMWAGTNPHYPIEATIFRCEILTGNLQKLRLDPEHWKKRTEEIRKEVLARESWIRESPRRRFPVAAYVLRDEKLLAEIRYELSAWLQNPGQSLDDHTTEPTDHRRQMRSHLNVVLCLGDPDDLPLLERLARNDFSGGSLMHMAGTIAQRYGFPASADVLDLLLRRGGPASDPRELAALREFQTGIPTRMRADEVILTLCRQMKLRPSEIGYVQAEENLLKLEPKSQLTKRQKTRFPTAIKNGSGCWYAPSLEVRRTAIEEMSKRLRKPAEELRTTE